MSLIYYLRDRQDGTIERRFVESAFEGMPGWLGGWIGRFGHAPNRTTHELVRVTTADDKILFDKERDAA